MSRTQKELKALRQQQREEAAARQRARDRRNLYIIGGVLGTAAIAILIVALALQHQAQVQIDNRLHFQAVSGTVWQKIDNLVEGQFVHNLEHGGIAILYNCPSGNDCTALKNQLENYVKNLAPAEPQFGKVKVVMTPYSRGMQKKIALVLYGVMTTL